MCPVDAYVAETHLVALIEQYGLERDDRSTDLLLRSDQEPWPFPPHESVELVRLAEQAERGAVVV